MPKKAKAKLPKLRPYRVDYFDIEEMKDNDLALVRSVVVRAVTAGDAIYEITARPELNTTNYPSLVVIRAYRYYKNLVHKKDVYKAVEDLFTANKAVEVMETVEAYRRKKSGGHVTRLSDSSLYDEVCTNCGATDASGKLNQPCPATAPAPEPTPAAAPATGPDSPATKAVVADLQGMLSHDAHEQAMDTFIPQVTPGITTPQLQAAVGTKEPFTVRTSNGKLGVLDPTATNEAAKTPTSKVTYKSIGMPWLHHDTEPPIEPDQAVGPTGRPKYFNDSPPPPPPNVFGNFPLWAKIFLFLGVLAITILTVLALLHH